MNKNRRKMLKTSSGWAVFCLAVASGLIKPGEVFASTDYPDKAFSAKSMTELMQALGTGLPTLSQNIFLTAPDIAENGAEVPVEIYSKLTGTTELVLLVANNPNLLAAQLILPEGTEPRVSLRVKMDKSSDVYALAKVDEKYYFAKKLVRVTLGGCGG